MIIQFYSIVLMMKTKPEQSQFGGNKIGETQKSYVERKIISLLCEWLLVLFQKQSS